MKHVAIIGGGWAGLACAVHLTEAGLQVSVFESARQLGGRARSVAWQTGNQTLYIDNGQHLMVGAYRDTLALLGKLGTQSLLERRPLDLRLPGFHLHLPKLPAPLHLALGLLQAKGLNWAEKWAAVRFIEALKARRFILDQDISAQQLFAAQPTSLIENLWAPLCIAALNTPLEQASAQVFCHVLRDSLMGTRADSDLLLNRADLNSLVPDAAMHYLQEHGAQVECAHRVNDITRSEHGFTLDDLPTMFSHVVVATHPTQLGALTARLPGMADIRTMLSSWTWQPILTLWLRFASPPRFPFSMIGLGPGQAPWAFERNDIAPGVVAIVESAKSLAHTSAENLLAEYLRQLSIALGPLPELLDWKIITEKRATYTCSPGLQRPANTTPIPGLFLAGDYTQGPYPATLEGAVMSGVKCARLIQA